MRALHGWGAGRARGFPRRDQVVKFTRRALMLGLALGALACSPGAFAAPTDSNEVIVPNGNIHRAAVPGASAGSSSFLTIGAVVLLGAAGGWTLWRGRGRNLMTMSRATKQLNIEETRGLGNRQYLVVATYQDKKFLLGVCAGRIDYLAPLTPTTPGPGEKPAV